MWFLSDLGNGARKKRRLGKGLPESSRPPCPLSSPQGAVAMAPAGHPWMWMAGALITALVMGVTGNQKPCCVPVD